MEWLECPSKHVQSCLNQARKASERLECPSKLIKRCLDQARKALERLKLPSKVTKRCLNQANKGLRKMESLCLSVCPTGASLACQERPTGGSWQARLASGKNANKASKQGDEPTCVPTFLVDLLVSASPVSLMSSTCLSVLALSTSCRWAFVIGASPVGLLSSALCLLTALLTFCPSAFVTSTFYHRTFWCCLVRWKL